MPVPLEPAQVREFAHGLTEVIVVEEKNPTLERLVRDALYDWDERPRVVGRRDDQGRPLIPAGGILDAERLIEPLRARLAARLDDRLAPLPAPVGGRSLIALSVERAPFFCSGCPHNTSTRVEPGTLVGGGIGCHAMVGLMEAERVGDLVGLTCMGNEGAQWIGMAPFLERKHLVQNLGDGTFFHSGSLAIRAAVAAGVDITYKLLHNGTVAMTGGQDAVGAVGVPDIAKMVLARGRQQGDRHHRRPRPLRRRPVPRGCRRVAPHPPRRGAEGAGRDPGHDGADPRPGVRGREPAGPQPRQARHPRLPGRHQRAGLRGLWRLRRQEQLPVGATGRHAVRTQDPHRPDELQLRLLVHGGRLPGVRHGVDRRGRARSAPARRRARSTSATSPSRRRSSTPPASPCGCRASAAPVSSPSARSSARRRCSPATPCAASTRPACRRRPDRSRATSASPTSRPSSSNHASVSGVDTVLAFDLLAAASDSHRRGATPDRTVVIANTHAVPTGEMVTHPDHRLPGVRLAARAARPGVAERAQPLLRRRRDHERAVRRHDDHQHLHARRRRPGRRRAGRPPSSSSGRSSSTASPSSATSRRSGGDAGWPSTRTRVEDGRRARRSAARDARRDDRTARRRPRRLPVTPLRRSLPRHRRSRSCRRAAGRARLDRAHRRGRPQPPQVDGVQGRVRGGPVAAPRRVARALRGDRRQAHEGHLPPAPADAAGDGDEEQAEVAAHAAPR